MNQRQPKDLAWIYDTLVQKLGKTYRPSQLDFMHTLYYSFFNKPVINFNESPTGTGKTFAYLVPSVLYAHDNPEEKIIVSTKSLTLQEQILKIDIPLIMKFFAETQNITDVKVAVLKGRNNYLCGFRTFKENVKSLSGKMDQINQLIEQGGEKSMFLEAGWTYKEWKKVETLDSRECLKTACPYYDKEQCCYMMAKKRAKEANIIIVNHYLVFTDLWNRANAVLEIKEHLIPVESYTNIIFDEAHLLEDIITKTFTHEYIDDMIADMVFSLKSRFFISAPEELETRLVKSAGELTRYIKNLEGDAVPPTDKLHKLIQTCDKAILEFNDILGEELENNDTLRAEGKVKVKASRSVLGDVHKIFNMVMYRDPKRFVVHKEEDVLKVTIIDYQDVLESKFFNPQITVNMVSATMAFQKQFYFPLRALFLDRIRSGPKITGKIYPSVFSKSQLQYVTPLNLVDYRDEKWEDQLVYIASSLIKKNNGSALLLFTSLKRMRSIYDKLSMEDIPYTMLIPSENTSKLDLVDKFKKDVNSILFGSYSFWEGIDVPGESLTLIIIDKLPFETPTELSKAVSEQFGGFLYQCYKTTIKLKQGVGRLIRSETDQGKIIICDNRLHNSGWGKQIYQNLQQ